MKIEKRQPPRLCGEAKTDAAVIENYLFYIYETMCHMAEKITEGEENNGD